MSSQVRNGDVKISTTMAAKGWYRYLLYRGASEFHTLGATYRFTGRWRRDIQGIKAILARDERRWFRRPGWAHPV